MTGVELVYNPAEDEIKRKTDRLNDILSSFNDAPNLGVVPEEGYIQATRATAVRDGLLESKQYWDAYHTKMKNLEGANPAPHSSFELRPLPRLDPASKLEDEATFALESLQNPFEAISNCQRVQEGLNGADPAEGSLGAAYKGLEKAARLFTAGEEDMMQVRDPEPKYLRKPGTRQKPAAPWDPKNGLVGDLVLVQVDPTANADLRIWDLGVILDPETLSVTTKGQTGLHVPAGLPGRDKVR